MTDYVSKITINNPLINISTDIFSQQPKEARIPDIGRILPVPDRRGQGQTREAEEAFHQQPPVKQHHPPQAAILLRLVQVPRQGVLLQRRQPEEHEEAHEHSSCHRFLLNIFMGFFFKFILI